MHPDNLPKIFSLKNRLHFNYFLFTPINQRFLNVSWSQNVFLKYLPSISASNIIESKYKGDSQGL